MPKQCYCYIMQTEMHCRQYRRERREQRNAPKAMSGNFPAFGLSRQYYLGKGLDINYLTSSLFFTHQMFKKIKIASGFFCRILYLIRTISYILAPTKHLENVIIGSEGYNYFPLKMIPSCQTHPVRKDCESCFNRKNARFSRKLSLKLV